jgi:radical SAM protein with 4Fe4S-binding SPASM domain
MQRKYDCISPAIALACILALFGCGASARTPTFTRAPVTVSIYPVSAMLLTGSTQQFTAFVTGSSNTAVTWSATGGTVSTNGLYTAPATAGTYSATATSQTPNGAVAGEAVGQINYLRNSVKAVVDAYTGAVTLYQWGPSDPLLRTWMNAFPGIIKPRSDIPAYLLPHLRYPPDQFEVQRQMLAKYHVTNPQSFYGGQNFWVVPNDPTGANTITSNLSQPPYYLTMTMPGYRQPEFSITTTMAQRSRPNLAAYIAVDSNPRSGYGTLRVLQLPQAAGNLRRERFADIWYHAPQLEQLRAVRESQLPVCSRCEIRTYCERCPGLAWMEGGDMLGAYERACQLAEQKAKLAGFVNPISAMHADQGPSVIRATLISESGSFVPRLN